MPKPYRVLTKKKIFSSFTFLFFFLFFYFWLSFCFQNFSLYISQAQVYDPALHWQVLESKYFSIIFPQKSSSEKPYCYEEIALHIAEIADQLCEQITPQFGKPPKPDHKIGLILEDFGDYIYGFASALPHRTIRINLTAPGFKNFNTKFDSWLKILIAHEYTHLAHFDMTNKGITFLRFFLGQIIVPNALQPLWSIEGLAIYNESKFNPGGRLQDSRYEMYLRSDFLENKLKKLDQLAGDYLVSWPGGNAPYIYGQSLVHFITQEYGEEKLIAISEEFSSFPILGMNWALKKVLGIDQNELFQNWKNKKQNYYEQQIEQIEKFSKITESQQLTNHDYWVDEPMWLSSDENENYLLYKVFTPQLYPTIRKYDLNSKKESILIKRTSGNNISYCLSPDNQYLLYSKLLKYNNHYTYHDLFLYNLNTGKQKQISEGMRIKDPTWHPDRSTGKIAAVINQAGTNNLVLFSLDKFFLENSFSQNNFLSFSDLVFLTDFSDGQQISQPVWSPQGNKIAFSLWYKGYQDIYILTIDEDYQVQSIKPITLDNYTDISPNWSKDGNYLFFSSDRSDIFNIYAYSINEEKLFRLTNVTTGAFEPAISPDGKEMAFIQYHSSGYELHIAKTENLLWQLTNNTPSEAIVSTPIIENNIAIFPSYQTNNKNDLDYQLELPNTAQQLELVTDYKITDYSPWDSIIPTYWIPYGNINEQELYLGFSTLAQDYLGFYSLPLTIAYGPLNNSLFYDFQLINYRYNPVISLSWKGETSLSSQFQLSLQFSKEGYTSQQDYGIFYHKKYSLRFQSESSLNKNNNKQENNFITNLTRINSLILSYNYDDTERYQASISPEIGHSFSLNYQYATSILESDVTFHKILFEARKYFPLPAQNQVLALRMVGGIVTDEINDKLQFNLGGNNSSSYLSSVNTDSFPLRGFPPSSFIGNHLFLTSLEYCFPIKKVEQKIGFKWASLFLERISGKLFLEAGNTWQKTILPNLGELNISGGIELNFKFKQRYDEPLILTLGIGKALTQPLKPRLYGQIGFSF